MAICTQCEGEMMDEISCLSDPITIGSESFQAIRWGDERESARWVIDFPCRDCHTPIGGVHHPGCCVERCPACLGQALGCPCFATDDDDDDYADFYENGEGDGENDCDRFGGGDGGAAGGRTVDDDGNDDDDDLAAHIRVSTRCRSHLFRRHFRR